MAPCWQVLIIVALFIGFNAFFSHCVRNTKDCGDRAIWNLGYLVIQIMICAFVATQSEQWQSVKTFTNKYPRYVTEFETNSYGEKVLNTHSVRKDPSDGK